ncbi:hypothetical protein EWH99_12030 [Sporolactobacillus sp. THM7-7]|nr:hypothetical protein EWH99_12030 [Sporolactobacillus sp. THM7-7]
MAVWTALFKKEMRLGSLGFIVFLIFELALMALGLYLGFRRGMAVDRAALVGIGAWLIACHFLYLFSYMVINVFLERKTFHLWLHNPLPGWSMLAAKWLSGVIYMTFSLLAAALYTLLGLAITPDIHIPPDFHPVRLAVVGIIYLYWIASYIGIIFTFLWLFYRVLRSRAGRWSWGIMLAGLIAAGIILTKLTRSGVFSVITDWGAIPASLVNYWLPFRYIPIDNVPIYIGDFVFDLFVMVFFFLLSAWLMDHKLEVS